jgi:hypothetical protein
MGTCFAENADPNTKTRVEPKQISDESISLVSNSPTARDLD